jgi:hypothetical protein
MKATARDLALIEIVFICGMGKREPQEYLPTKVIDIGTIDGKRAAGTLPGVASASIYNRPGRGDLCGRN